MWSSCPQRHSGGHGHGRVSTNGQWRAAAMLPHAVHVSFLHRNLLMSIPQSPGPHSKGRLAQSGMCSQ
jgi:hypothetical protein